MKEKPHVILLAALGLARTPRSHSSPFETCLEWILHALDENGIPRKHIGVVGGRDIGEIVKSYPEFTFFVNPEWSTTRTVASLLKAKEWLRQFNCIISYTDVVYRPELIHRLLEAPDDAITAVADTDWLNRFPGRDADSLRKAEKLWLENGKITKATRLHENASEADAELAAGLLSIPLRCAPHVISLEEKISVEPFHGSENFRQSVFADLIQEFINQGKTVRALETDGKWAEMDEPQDFGRFIFGTKSQTLERLQPVLKHGVILPQYAFTVREWRENRQSIIDAAQSRFSEDMLIIRSSSLREDALDHSYAGAFTSILDTPRTNVRALSEAIEKVVASFGADVKDGDQVLVQPQVGNVLLSGVLFTCDIRTGAPYYTVNFDTSGRTDGITGGRCEQHELHYIYKWKKDPPEDPHLANLIACARELEKLTGNETIDIEFAIDTKGTLFVFQARPLTSPDILRRYDAADISGHLRHAKMLVEKRIGRKPHLAGGRSVLGDMPDWNPAELIGARPKPLAHSLFETLIMKDAWREARRIIGYVNPAPERLMVTLCGHPYIDVRCSLNSYIPEDLPLPIRGKLVDEAIIYLTEHPDAHDKLEFEVATTCFTPFIETRLERWRSAGFTADEIAALKDSLLRHTEKIIRGEYYGIADLMNMVEDLNRRREIVLENADDYSTGDIARFLLDDCAVLGTVPFSSLARMAFIGSTFLRSFAATGAISEHSYHGFLNGIDTVATGMGRALSRVSGEGRGLEEFLKEYGHLRPGTYEIESFRYDENPSLYFGDGERKAKKEMPADAFVWGIGEKDAMQNLLRKTGMTLSIDDVLTFARESIRGRERAKFLYSRNISDLLSVISRWGEECGISRNDLAFITIHRLLEALDNPGGKDSFENLRQIVENARREYEERQQIIMPQLIFRPDDLEHVHIFGSRPNFITGKTVVADAVTLTAAGGKQSIAGRIVLIESADPGFDWIFTHGIAGLITKYGGAASHMAIRCAEFGLPAAIGAGSHFDDLLEKKTIRLDCANHTIL